MRLPELSKRPQGAERPSLAVANPGDLGLGAAARDMAEWEGERRRTQDLEEEVQRAHDEEAVKPLLDGLQTQYEARFAQDGAAWDGATPGFARGAMDGFEQMKAAVPTDDLTPGQRDALTRGLTAYGEAVGQRAISYESQRRGALAAEAAAARQATETGAFMARYMSEVATGRKEIDDSFDGSQADYSERVLAVHDAAAAQLIEEAPEALKPRVTAQLAQERLRLQATSMEVAARGQQAYVLSQARAAGDALVNAVLTAPSMYEGALAQVDQALAGVPAGARAAERTRLIGETTEAYVTALIRDGQQDQALSLLNGGALDARLDPSRKARLLDQATRKSEELDVGDWMARLRAEGLMDDNIASITATGEGVAGADPASIPGLTAREAAAYALRVEEAKRVHAATPGFGQMTEAEIAAHVEGLRPEPGTEGFAEAQQRFTLAQQAAAREIESRKDPAAWGLRQAPGLAETMAEIGQGGDAGRRAAGAYAVGQLTLQETAGIEAADRRIFSKTRAAEIVNRAETDPDPAHGLIGLGTTLHAFEPPAGADGTTITAAYNRQRMVINELKAAGADNADIAAAMDLADDPVRLGRYVAATRGRALESMDKSDRDDIGEAARTALAPYLRSFQGMPVSAALTAGRVEMTARLAAERIASRGGSVRDAAREAAEVVSGNYAFVGAQGWRMPAAVAARSYGGQRGEQLAQRGAGRVVATLSVNDGAGFYAPRREGLTEEQSRRRYADTVRTTGRWVTTPDDRGVVLMTPTLDGGWTPALNRGGAPVVQTWAQLIDAGRAGSGGISRDAPATVAPRGVRNNNPGNIEHRRDNRWQGQTGNDGRFARFATPEHGLRALAVDLRTKSRRGLDTVQEIISAWAPPNENDTGAYVAGVTRGLSQAFGRTIGANERLDMNDPRVVAALMAGIIRHENGQQPYAPELLRQAARRAIAR